MVAVDSPCFKNFLVIIFFVSSILSITTLHKQRVLSAFWVDLLFLCATQLRFLTSFSAKYLNCTSYLKKGNSIGLLRSSTRSLVQPGTTAHSVNRLRVHSVNRLRSSRSTRALEKQPLRSQLHALEEHLHSLRLRMPTSPQSTFLGLHKKAVTVGR